MESYRLADRIDEPGSYPRPTGRAVVGHPELGVRLVQEVAHVVQQGGQHQCVLSPCGTGQRRGLPGVLFHGHPFGVGNRPVVGEQRQGLGRHVNRHRISHAAHHARWGPT